MTTGLPWTAQQREWLVALGHDVLGLASSGPAQADMADTVAASVGRPTPMAGPPRPPAAEIPPPAPLRSSAQEARRPAGGVARAPAESALLRALAQAARRAPDDGEFLRALPPLASLRGNPAARRALWPRLRALRRGARP